MSSVQIQVCMFLCDLEEEKAAEDPAHAMSNGCKGPRPWFSVFFRPQTCLTLVQNFYFSEEYDEEEEEEEEEEEVQTNPDEYGYSYL